MDELAAQQGAGAMVVEPSTPFLSGCAALNWIAFRRAEDGDLTGYHNLWREFGYQPKRPPDFNVFDYAAAEAAGQLSSEQQARMADLIARLGKEPRDVAPAREKVARVVSDRSWQPEHLLIYLEARRQVWVSRSNRHWAAQLKLTNALAAEGLTAWASRAAPAAPEQGLNHARPTAAAAVVPWTFFLTLNAFVHPTGTITADGDPGYVHAQFRTKEVLAIWPTVLAQHAEPVARFTEPSVTSRTAASGANYGSSDNVLLDEMELLIESGKARNVQDAARALVGRAEGLGSPESKVKRLTGKYNRRSQSGQS